MQNSEHLGGDARFAELMHRLRSTGVGKSVSASEWQEVEGFIEENILTEEKIQEHYDSGYKTGAAYSVSRIRNELLECSSRLFLGGKDAQAAEMRTIANSIK